jgi:Concanavalin A-like lectin/glucanases superfamily
MANLQSLTVNDTGNLTLPNGTNTNRPSLYTNSAIQWTNTGTQSYTVLSGSATGTNTTWTCPAGVTSIEVLVVAGGGGGGYNGGGGGAGGLIYTSAYPVVPTTVYTVVVGAGGAGAANLSGSNGSNGSNSSFDALVALGGGGGATAGNTGNTGGSGGAGAYAGGTYLGTGGFGVAGAGTPGQGFPGGFGSNYSGGNTNGGGGGAGGPGYGSGNNINPGTNDGQAAGNGGPGVLYNISGTPTYYAGGGGGASWINTTVGGVGGVGGGGNGGSQSSGSAGTASTGGGGGGGGSTGAGAAGGSGIVILRYTLASASADPRGEIRFNTSTKETEVYNLNNRWSTAPNSGERIVANGLILSIDGARYSTGTTWADLSGTGNDLTIANTPTYSTTDYGFFTFNGTNQYASKTSFNSLTGNASYTIAAWVKFTTANVGAGTDAPIVWIGGQAADTVACLDQKGNYFCSLHYGDDQSFTNFAITAGIWYYAVITYNNSTKEARLYVNGNFVQSLTHSGALNIPSNTTIAVGGDAGTRYGPNSIGQTQVYSRILTDAEIKQNYSATFYRYESNQQWPAVINPISTGNLILHLDAGHPGSYPGYGTTWFDMSGQGINVSMVNRPLYNPNYGSFIFNGSSHKGTFPAVTLPTTTAVTISMWVLAYSVKYMDMFDLLDTAGIWMVFNTGNVMGIALQNPGPIAPSYAINTWYNVVQLCDSSQSHQVYVNGVWQGNNTTGLSGYTGLSLSTARIGNVDGDRASEYWNGEIANLSIWNRALTPQEISNNFQTYRKRFGV